MRPYKIYYQQHCQNYLFNVFENTYGRYETSMRTKRIAVFFSFLHLQIVEATVPYSGINSWTTVNAYNEIETLFVIHWCQHKRISLCSDRRRSMNSETFQKSVEVKMVSRSWFAASKDRSPATKNNPKIFSLFTRNMASDVTIWSANSAKKLLAILW